MGDLSLILIWIHPKSLPCLELEIELLFFILLLCEIPVKGRHLDSFIWFLSTNDQFIGTLLAGILPILVLLLGGRELFLKSCSIILSQLEYLTLSKQFFRTMGEKFVYIKSPLSIRSRGVSLPFNFLLQRIISHLVRTGLRCTCKSLLFLVSLVLLSNSKSQGGFNKSAKRIK